LEVIDRVENMVISFLEYQESMRIRDTLVKALWVALFILLILCSRGARAALPTCTASGTAFTVSMPPTLTIPRDIAANQPLTNWTSVNATNLWTCTNANDGSSNYWSGGLAISPGTSLGASIGSYSDSGQTYPVYATGVAGVGVVMGFDLSRAGNCTGTTTVAVGTNSVLSGLPSGWATGGCYWQNQAGNSQLGGTFRVRLIRTTGTVTAQTLNGGILAVSKAYVGGPSGSIPTSASLQAAPTVSFSMSPVNLVSGACITPDVVVPMGTHLTKEFSGINTFTSAVSFNVGLNNCPVGINTIQYQIQPTTAIVNSAQSVVALDSSSGATGVGVQLLNSAGTAAFPLNAYQTFSGYNSATGGDYTIPFKARYYQTSATVAAGTANTSMYVTLLYQ
jgi:major type 1 subunit fimbrin (pilin)